jgi:hypothetical protein
VSTVILILLIVGSLGIASLTFVTVRGRGVFRVAFSILRAVVFFLLFYFPLIEQPRILDSPVMKTIAGMILVVGIVPIRTLFSGAAPCPADR